MSDAYEKPDVDAVPPDPIFADDELEVFVEREAPAADVSALRAELEAKAQELQIAKQQTDPVAALKESIAALGGALKPEAPVDVSVKPSGAMVNWQQYKANFNEKFFEDPFAAATDLLAKQQEMLTAQSSQQNLYFSKRLVASDPATKDIYSKYSDEIEREVAKMPPSVRATNPNVYEDATRLVKAKHLDEIVTEMVAKKLEEALGEKKPAAQSRSQASQYVERASNAPVASAPSRAKTSITEAKMREIESYADEYGIPVEAAIRLYKNRGKL